MGGASQTFEADSIEELEEDVKEFIQEGLDIGFSESIGWDPARVVKTQDGKYRIFARVTK